MYSYCHVYVSLLCMLCCVIVRYALLCYCYVCSVVLLLGMICCVYSVFIPATLTEVFSCFFLSCKANATVYLADGARSALFLIS